MRLLGGTTAMKVQHSQRFKKWIGGKLTQGSDAKKRNKRHCKKHTVIYLVAAGSEEGKYPVKIGVTRSLERRLSNLQTGNPYKITLLAQLLVPNNIAYKVESEIHKRLGQYLMRGEWYLLEKEQTHRLIQWFNNRKHSDFSAFFENEVNYV